MRHFVAVGTCFTPDGKQLLSIGETDECLTWDVVTGKQIRSLPRESFPLGISRDSKLSVSWAKDELKIMEWPDGKAVHMIPLKKLLTVSFADRTRSIVAGIRTERPSLDALVGAQALFVVNLPPKTLRGQLSEGMLFDIGFADGLRPAFAQPEWPVPDGVRAG